MPDVGISIYPSRSRFADDRAYLDLARKYGFTRIFTSLLEIQGDSEEVVRKFKKIIEYGNSIGMKTILDINPSLFKQLKIGYDDLRFFKELGAAGIRLDLGFTGAEESKMTKNPYQLIIEINMSSGTNYLDHIMSFQPNSALLFASHNFYPQEYSGLSQKHFEKTTKKFNQYHIHTAAFVTSQHGMFGPWPVQDGLCTLEQHRKLDAYTQALHFKLIGTIDDVLIGNAYATEEELKDVSQAYLSMHPTFKIVLSKNATVLEKKMLLGEVHQYRGDCSEYMIRSSTTRMKSQYADLTPHDVLPIKQGDILICNNDFGQYRGEMQIALRDMDNAGNRNVVGHIPKQSLFLLDYLKPWSSFKFALDK